jgi:Co/Zn/Cd efflux system component
MAVEHDSDLGQDRAVPATAETDDCDSCGCDVPKNLSTVTPGYKRALWIVVLLNLGYGVTEMFGGFLAGSQALKADALDFLGDGLITSLALISGEWGPAWRARSALIQGLFLAALGVSVFAGAIYRAFVVYQPEAELMGGFGAVALLINVLAAAVLVPHRAGDSSARAVWLFSRNDAIGNLVVVIAAGLVAWTNTGWPDLAAALLIASLFLQSAWSIVRHALRDLREARAMLVPGGPQDAGPQRT